MVSEEDGKSLQIILLTKFRATKIMKTLCTIYLLLVMTFLLMLIYAIAISQDSENSNLKSELVRENLKGKYICS